MKKTILIILAVSLLVCGATPQVAAQTLEVGATPRPHAEVLELIKPDLAEMGIDLKVIEFTDYVQPNLALAEGELDANYFQHIPYLEAFSQDHRLDLTYIAKVHIEPMGAYSEKLKSIDELKKVPESPSPTIPSMGAGLMLLAANELIELNPAAGSPLPCWTLPLTPWISNSMS